MLRVVAAIGIVLSLLATATAQTPKSGNGPQGAAVAAAPGSSQTVADDAALADGLVGAMRLNADRTERLAEPGEAIRAYIKAGYVKLKPELRDEYTDYRVVGRPAKFFGQELLVIEEEYLSKFIGCCVNEGVGVILRVTADLAPLKAFASANGCSVRDDRRDTVERLQKLKVKPAEGELVRLSCRERDRM
jgi:hypothetical protein